MKRQDYKSSNRILIIISVLLIVVLAGLYIVFGRGNGKESVWKYESYEYFDTITEITIYDSYSEEEYEELKSFITERLNYYHQLFDIYHNYDGINNAKVINDKAGIEPVTVPEELCTLIDKGRLMYIETQGKLNIALGPVLEIWHTYREEGKELPPTGTLIKAAANTHIEDVQVKGNVVYLNREGMKLDLGSIGKGYAAELIAEDLKERGIKNALISLGGNIVAVGDKHKEGYTVGIEDPEKEGNSKVILKIKDTSVVTSGDYQRYYEVDGKRYCHIIDPDSLYPTEYYRSVTVICNSSFMADAYATALFNMDYKTGYEMVDSFDDIEAMWILKDGTVKYSKGFEQYIK